MGCVIGGHQIMTSIPTNTPFHNMLRYNRIEENKILLCLLEQFFGFAFIFAFAFTLALTFTLAFVFVFIFCCI